MNLIISYFCTIIVANKNFSTWKYPSLFQAPFFSGFILGQIDLKVVQSTIPGGCTGSSCSIPVTDVHVNGNECVGTWSNGSGDITLFDEDHPLTLKKDGRPANGYSFYFLSSMFCISNEDAVTHCCETSGHCLGIRGISVPVVGTINPPNDGYGCSIDSDL